MIYRWPSVCVCVCVSVSVCACVYTKRRLTDRQKQQQQHQFVSSNPCCNPLEKQPKRLQLAIRAHLLCKDALLPAIIELPI